MTDAKITRRRLIATGAAAGAGAMLARVPGAGAYTTRERRRGPREVDVAIVGAGLAGLTAALHLRRADRSVVVLEARNRVGGRVWNHELGNGVWSERGGTFVGPTQGHIRGLARQFGVDEFPTYDEGDNVYVADGLRLTYSDASPIGIVPPDPLIIPDIALLVTRLDQMATKVPVDAPWRSSQAHNWDQQTLESWLRINTTYSVNSHLKRLVAVATRPIFGAEARELSLLFTLFYIAASGDERHPGTFERNFSTRNGAQMFRFDGGSELIVKRIARHLGDRVRLGEPVRKIVQENGRAVVESDGGRFHAKRVIVAIPPTLAGRIQYRPVMPYERDQLTQRIPQGTLMKVAATYARPFWRADGLTGSAISLNGPISFTVDDSPPGGKPGVIFGFVGGDNARSFARMSRSRRRAAVLKELVSCFGSRAAHPTDYFETNWATEQWSRGCPVAIPGPGALLAYGPWLRRPVGRIHWAGTETSSYWMGYMDGAVRSGERAAQEILDEL